MSDTPLVRLERHDDGVAVVHLQNGKVNSLSTALLRQLGELIDDLVGDLPGALVVTGGERMFSAGADVEELTGAEAAREVTAAFHSALDAVAGFPRATVAAVSGYALGGGCELALACDFRVAAETARLGLPEILLGIIPGGGGTQRLARLVGPARAKDLVLTGRQVRAEEAAGMGLVDEVVSADAVLDRAMDRARRLAAGPLAAHELAKRAIDEGLDLALPEGLALERRLFGEVFDTQDSRTGITTFLAEGPGKARFAGR